MIDELTEQEFNNAETYLESEEMQNEDSRASKSLMAWDPRLKRIDAFLMADSNHASIIVPFSSDTAASSFYDMVFSVPAAIA